MRRALFALMLAVAPSIAAADSGWPSIRAEVFGDRPIAEGSDAIRLDAPARTDNDRSTPMAIVAALPAGEAIRAMTLIIDENPMPVSAQIEMLQPVPAAAFGFTMRMNGPSPVRAIVETGSGRLLMREAMVKTSGVGACAAPPGVDEATALATLGQMELSAAEGGADSPGRLRLSVSHPSYSGLQMDQVTLLYTPMRYLETIEIWADDVALFRITGSISYGENPAFTFDRPLGAETLRVRLTDTDGAIFERRFPLGSG
jgi:sulfur-oxidizing protein SoxY